MKKCLIYYLFCILSPQDVMTLFDEYKELKKQIEEAIYSPQDGSYLIINQCSTCFLQTSFFCRRGTDLFKHSKVVFRRERDIDQAHYQSRGGIE